MLSFQANTVTAEYDEYGVLIIALANLQNDEPQNYFMIQDSEEYDEQDRELGMDTYYIERDKQIFSSYGGIKTITLNPVSLRIELNEKGARQLEASIIEISYQLTASAYDNLKAKLEKIMGNHLTVSH
jgi:hypothetical protein